MGISKRIDEDATVQASQWHVWVSSDGTSAYTRKVKVYRTVRTYIVDCIEQSVAWASSLVNCFEQKASAGTILAFKSDLSVRSVTSTNVYVIGVSFTAENVGNQNIGSFVLSLLEA